MKNLFFPFLVGVACLFSACENSMIVEETPTGGDPTGGKTVITKAVFSGYVQKGPFINGSSVAISELDENLDQTGRIYLTTIADNSGSFEKKNIELVSNYVALKADGYYFNEISGKTSVGQITLYALVDVEDINSANVNVLTHLEKPRVEYLATQKGMSFADAKKQAQREVLAIFGFEPVETSSETLNLTDNAVLLAISCILQGHLPTGDMMALMANICADIKADGVLDDTALGTKLISNAYAISLSSYANIRKNIINRYSELGIETVIPDFESYIQAFVDSNLYPKTSLISYPDTGSFGENILSDAVIFVKKNKRNSPTASYYWYSMKADVPEGLSLKIVLKSTSLKGNQYNPDWTYVAIPTPLNWHVGQYVYNETGGRQEFAVIEGGKANDLQIAVYDGTWDENYQPHIIIEYYEGNSTTPTKLKRLYIEDSDTEPNVPCEFTNPLTDLPFIQEIINSYANSPTYPGFMMKAKIYQCVYGADRIGFILDHVTLTNCPDCEVTDHVKTLYSCSGKILCDTRWNQGAPFLALNVRNEVLIYE